MATNKYIFSKQLSNASRLLVLIMTLCWSAPTLHAYDFGVDGIYYNKDASTKTASVTYYSSAYKAYNGTIHIPSEVKYDGVIYAVTSIGNSAFSGCSDLTEITIANGVESIGSSAFYNCKGLTKINLPNSIKSIGSSAFKNCSELTEVYIGSDVTSIGSSAFDGCSRLTMLNIADGVEMLKFSSSSTPFSGCPIERLYLGRNISYSSTYSPFKNNTSLKTLSIGDKVTYIRASAFYGCTGLTDVTISNSVTSIGTSAFEDCCELTNVTIPNSVTSIGTSAFEDCCELTNVTIPNSVTSIGSSAFSGCSKLTEINITDGTDVLAFTSSSSFSGCPIEKLYLGRNISYSSTYSPFKNNTFLKTLSIGDKVTYIEPYAFEGCIGLTNVTIPNNITSIRAFAFAGCNNLTDVTIPNNVTYIGDSAFEGCSELAEITIADGVDVLAFSTSSASTPFSGCPIERLYLGRNISYSYSPFRSDAYLKTLSIGDKVTNIGYSAFYGCEGLTDVTIQNGVTSIGAYAFYGCSGLTEVTIPNSVTSIKASAFEGCIGLTEVKIPNNVTSIESSAFAGCNKLTGMLNIPSSVKSIGEAAFEGCSELTELNIANGADELACSTSSFSGCPIDKLYLGRNIIYSSSNSPFRGNTALKTLVIGDSVTSIGSYAFDGCSELTGTLSIPNNITSIGSSAFKGCKELKEVNIADGTNVLKFFTSPSSTPFSDCNIEKLHLGRTINYDSSYSPFCGNISLKTLIIGDNVTSIEASAFKGCIGLMEITIPNSVISIGSSAFQDCSGLTGTLTIPNSVISIGASAFDGCSELTEINIADGADELAFSTSSSSTPFRDCNIEKIHLGRTINYNSSYSPFKGNTSLKTLTIGDKVTAIGSYAFKGCSGLTGTLTIPNSVTSIESYAFEGCCGLTGTLTIPDSATSIESYAFKGCSGLTGTLTIPNSITSIEVSAFEGCTGLTSITIPNNVTSIASDAFAGCKGLTSVTLGCKEVGAWFRNLSNIKQIIMEEGVESIAKEAFYGTRVDTLIIPSTVKKIGEYALSGSVIYCYATTPPETSALDYNMGKTILYVPMGSGKAYSNASYWKNFAIVEMDSENIDWTEGSVTVNVETAGQLRLNIVELEKEKVERLVVKGYINSTDLKYLRELTGKLSDLESLDLSDVTLVYDNECYFTGFTKDDVSLTAGDYVYYYLSEEEREEHWKGGLSLGGSSRYSAYYGNQLAGAFQDLPLKHIVMPKSVTRVGRETFNNCGSLIKVEYPGGIKRIDDFAFSNCERLRSFDIEQTDTIGTAAFYNCWMLERIDGIEKVVHIGKDAFNGCSKWRGNNNHVLSLANVDSIPEQAFYGCSMLNEVRLSNKLYSIGEKAFSKCTSLTTIKLPESLTILPAGAFADCTELQEVAYPSSLLHVDTESFKNTPWMDNLPSENGVKYMGHIAMSYDANSDVASTSPATLTFREGTTTIADRFVSTLTWQYVNNITALDFPSTLRRIGDEAFVSNSSTSNYGKMPIATLTLPQGLEEIGTSAFANAPSLTKLSLSESLKHIGDQAFAKCAKLTQVAFNAKDVDCSNIFSDCKSLEKVTIGAKAQRLPEGTFSGCTNLMIVQADERTDNTPLEIGASAFSNCTNLTILKLPTIVSAIGSEAFTKCTSLSTFTIPQDVTTISKGTFDGCTGLTSIQLHDKVKTIGDRAFAFCSQISSFTLPESLDSIGEQAFTSCYALKELTIPANVTRLGEDFIHDCYNLTKLTCHIATPQPLGAITSMSNEVIQNVYGYYYDWSAYRYIHYDEVTLYVPKGCKSIYQETDGWKRFRNIETIGGEEEPAVYKLTYIVDGEIYKTLLVEYGAEIIAEPEPTKEGYAFSGWSEIPSTMPDHDVIITGSYTLIVGIQGITTNDSNLIIYNLAGQRVTHPIKGNLYIVNGKKVLMK